MLCFTLLLTQSGFCVCDNEGLELEFLNPARPLEFFMASRPEVKQKALTQFP